MVTTANMVALTMLMFALLSPVRAEAPMVVSPVSPVSLGALIATAALPDGAIIPRVPLHVLRVDLVLDPVAVNVALVAPSAVPILVRVVRVVLILVRVLVVDRLVLPPVDRVVLSLDRVVPAVGLEVHVLLIPDRVLRIPRRVPLQVARDLDMVAPVPLSVLPAGLVGRARFIAGLVVALLVTVGVVTLVILAKFVTAVMVSPPGPLTPLTPLTSLFGVPR